MAPLFARLRDAGFDIDVTYHAEAILLQEFPEAADELEGLFLDIEIPVEELIRGGGGVAKITQRLRRALHAKGWLKQKFNVEKKINDRTTFAQSHEVDHVKAFSAGTIALEIEWNNKDPFFDRDLENFQRLHADGGISIGAIITRGSSLQSGIGAALLRYARAQQFASFDDLRHFGLAPTQRQRDTVAQLTATGSRTFAEAWSQAFIADKYGTATTHWDKLTIRMARGVGSPCPLIAFGIPLSCVRGIPAE